MGCNAPSPILRLVGFIEPCLPTLARAVADGPRRAHEVSTTATRTICRRDDAWVRVFTRRGYDWNDRVTETALRHEGAEREDRYGA